MTTRKRKDGSHEFMLHAADLPIVIEVHEVKERPADGGARVIIRIRQAKPKRTKAKP